MNAVTDPITQMRRQEQSLPVMKERYADEGTGAVSSSDEGEDTGPESSNDETRIGSRFQ